jgi:CheY-like chemotaxis protein
MADGMIRRLGVRESAVVARQGRALVVPVACPIEGEWRGATVTHGHAYMAADLAPGRWDQRRRRTSKVAGRGQGNRRGLGANRTLPDMGLIQRHTGCSQAYRHSRGGGGVNSDQVIQLISAVGGLLAVLVWPAVVLFFLVRFRRALADFFSNLGELSLKTPGMEATAKRQQVEAAAALGAAMAKHAAEGSTETIADPRDVAESLPSPRTQRQLQASRILWVDDRPSNNRFERQALEALGIQISLSTSTEDALERTQRQSYDLIISDMGRPPDSRAGYTLLDKLRSDGNKTPFVIYASSRAPEHVREAIQHGATGCTNSPQELLEIVTRALTERR